MRITTRTTGVPRTPADDRTRVRPSMRVGLVICGLLALFDVAGLGAVGSDDAPPAAVLILGGVLGLVTLVALRAAWRARRAAVTAVVVSRVLSALGGVPAFFADDAPDWAPPVVALGLFLTAVAVTFIYTGGRRSRA